MANPTNFISLNSQEESYAKNNLLQYYPKLRPANINAAKFVAENEAILLATAV